MSWYQLHWINLILNAKDLKYISSGGEGGMGGHMPPKTFSNFCGSCYNMQYALCNIQAKPYATSKMELFLAEIR